MASWLDDSEDEGSDSGTGFVLATKTVQNVSPQSVIDAAAEIEGKQQSQSLVAVLGDSSEEEEEEEEEEESPTTVDGGKGEVTESQPSPPKAKVSKDKDTTQAKPNRSPTVYCRYVRLNILTFVICFPSSFVPLSQSP